MLRKIGANNLLESLLNEERPDVVIHPTVLEGLFVSDLIRWGEMHGTPTIFIMNSWDNPATKAMMVGAPSQLIVWGEQTKQHAIRHMHISADRVVSLGVAQFDLYRHSPKEGPAEYRARLGIPLDKRVLLYAGSSKGLDETSHLRKLEEAIEKGILEDCMVLYRPHPWRVYPQGETDFFSLNWKHVMLEPCMATCYQQYRLGKRMPVDSAKYEDTHVTLGAVDAVISPLSTILLEAAMHGKPIAVYLPDDDMKQNQHLSTVARMVHFTEFFEKIDCIKCERLDDLVRDCRRLLEKSRESGISDALKQQTAYFVEPSDRPYAERLNSLIQALLSDKSRPTVREA
jgi:CDP-glycerol glycerophosphotransferase (TagB/SpsB family)